MSDKDTTIILFVIAAFCLITLAMGFIILTRISRLVRNVSSLKQQTAETSAQISELRRDVEECRRDIDGSDQRQEALRQSLDSQFNALRNENRRQLEDIRFTVDEKLQKTLDDKLARSFESVSKSLDEVYRSLGEIQTLADGVGDLKKVLSNVKTRGIMGEIQLGSIIEQIMPKDQYLENVITVPASKERVEFAIKMPGDGNIPVLLPIDAKFPGDSYRNLLDAYESADSAAVLQARKNLINVIKKEAKDIHEKYVLTPYTTEFAVMFLPFEGLYAEVVNLGLLEILQRESQIMIAGPSTMAALLNSLQMGFKAIAIQKNAGRVWTVLGGVKGEFDKFGDILSTAQNHINQVNKDLDQLIGTRTRAIQRKLDEMQSLNDGN